MLLLKAAAMPVAAVWLTQKRRGRLPVWREEPACSIAMRRQPCTLQATLCIHFFCTMRMVHQTVLMM